jgi:trehalose 6-phosphate synthase
VSPNGAADLVIVANRLPVDRITNPDGSPGWRGSPGGLVTAIEPIMRANSGTWVGWPGDSEGRLEPFEYDGMALDPIALSEAEIAGFYEGFSNATLWPLYHDVVAKPEFHREWWDAYVNVNQRFAEHAASRAAEDATVWVHDYQLQLVPQLLRELRPDLRIGFYLHIPFPPAELFQQLPWRRQLLEGLLGADLVGFQLPGGAANFVRLVRQRVGHKTHRDLVYLPEGRTVRAAAFPISIDYKGFEKLAKSEEVAKRATEIRTALGDPTKVFLGIDRLDYTKGIYARLRAFSELVRDGELDVEHAVFVQVATPSREQVEEYRVLRDDIDRLVGRINGDLGGHQLPPLVVPARGDGRLLPRRRRHGDHPLPRWDEPGRQGVRRLPVRRGRRSGALGVRRRSRRAPPGLAGQPLRHQRHQGRVARGLPGRPQGPAAPDAGDASHRQACRRRGVGPELPRRARQGPAPARQAAQADTRRLTDSTPIARNPPARAALDRCGARIATGPTRVGAL